MPDNSYLSNADVSYIDELYKQYKADKGSLDFGWQKFFEGFDLAGDKNTGGVSENMLKEINVLNLIDGYRKRGHLFTKTNPVRERRKYSPTLAIENFGLEKDDLETTFDAGVEIGIGSAKLKDIIAHLEATYCESIGVEYGYIPDPEKVEWLKRFMESGKNQPNLSTTEKKHFLAKLNQATVFENFIHTKYIGQKRFSLEGLECLIPALDAVVQYGAELGVEEFVMGMAHRGRLNVLANIFNKSYQEIFSEFEGKVFQDEQFEGDVKYHLGYSTDVESHNGKKIHLSLSPNPSHLEAVNPVVKGTVRAKLDSKYKGQIDKICPILIHGDAAVAGQGVVYEVVQMSGLEANQVGGTIHMVTNNQIGFTTNYTDARTSIYCTDIAKVTKCPVFHVNADDVEAVIYTVKLAMAYRLKFNTDIFIDILGYRKYGHNEGDEPKFTQPILYKAIAKHKNPRDIYAERLISEGVIDDSYVSELEKQYKEALEEKLEDSRKEDKTEITPFMADEWKGFSNVREWEMMDAVDTTFDKKKLTAIAKVITELPDGKKFLRKVEKLIRDRKKMFFETDKLDWAMGELLAYGTLLEEGFGVRMSGQDVERGTFSHRHAVMKVEESEEEVLLLNHLSEEQGKFQIYNSLLSEYGVVGFDYGYAMASPNTLTIWEAQFGDFSNGAQIMIDQYISAAEDKWKLQNGLVMLLPHGYEGQGAEHSSARMERYLQLCAKDNMYIADVTTPAQIYHIIRRQMKANFRKPLILFTPKSLLRHPKAVSSVDDFANGSFKLVIDDSTAAKNKVKSLVFCTGKFYYDLLAEKENLNRDDVALVRVEQLFPLPEEQMKDITAKYKNAKDVVWAQEEPRNMGAWSHIMMHYDEAHKFRIASRRFYAAPAAGSSVRSKARHQQVIDYVFDKTKDNMTKHKNK